MYKMIPVSMVVIFASIIADRAPLKLKPSRIACFSFFPFANSSLIRSKIITFASTDIPIVKIIPAIPGRVNTNPKAVRIPNINNTFTIKAISAKTPAFP